MSATRPNRRWIWFFLLLILLSLAAIITLIAYNLSLQLKPEQLAAARQRWQDHGLRSYQLSYARKLGADAPESFVVRVRSGRVVSVSLAGRTLEKRLFAHHGMEAMFDHIQEFLDRDARPGQPRTYTKAVFDPATGAVRHYVRRVMGSTERLEITVESLVPLDE